MTLFIVLYALFAIYMVLNFKRDIHVFQTNSYRPMRLWRWLRAGNMLPAWRLVDLALILLLLTPFMWVGLIALPVTLIVKCVMILRAKYKKPLVFTKRVWRLYSATALLALAIYGAVIALTFTVAPESLNPYYMRTPQFTPLLAGLLITIFSWAIMLLGNLIMMPIEKAINRHYYNDARRILKSMPSLKIIGITGSYGKTSTKHYLEAILSRKYETLMTPGSFNTPMGVIRTVREYMKPYHEIFICEMGAKQKGDIKEICDLVDPHYGIITAVGPMHLETFKNMETVQSTKFELADALPANGLAIVNNDFDYCASRPVENVKCVRYGISNPDKADYKITNTKYTSQGTTFTIQGPDGYSIELQTRLIGDSNLSNLMAAVIMARELGVSDEQIRTAVARIEQVEHRLSMRRTGNGVTIIDDAYNSNPVGSRMAVEALGRFESGKRIVVTPGMIELGSKQHELNKELGENIAKNVDMAVIVGQYNRQAILEGIKAVGKLSDDNVIVVDTFMQAMEYLNPRMQSGDVLLLENDLPDTFK